MIGLVCATDEEFSNIYAQLKDEAADHSMGMFRIMEGNISGKKVVLSCSGSGKVAAAALTQLLIDRYRPDAIINFGAASSLVEGLYIGDIVVPEKIFQGDVGVVHSGGFGGASLVNVDERLANTLEYSADPSLLGVAQNLVREWEANQKFSVYFNPAVTCDQIILSRDAREDLNKSFNAVAVDMESAAAACIAANSNTPFLAVRSISDSLESNIETFQEMYQYMGESKTARWWRKAKFSVLHPREISRVSAFIDGIGKAAANSAGFICKVLEEME